MTVKMSKTISYSAVVGSIQEAFELIMDRMDEFSAPDIRISPTIVFNNLPDEVSADVESYFVSIQGFDIISMSRDALE